MIGLSALGRAHGSSRRIMILRFRPANIRLIDRRTNQLRLLLAMSSGKDKIGIKAGTGIPTLPHYAVLAERLYWVDSLPFE